VHRASQDVFVTNGIGGLISTPRGAPDLLEARCQSGFPPDLSFRRTISEVTQRRPGRGERRYAALESSGAWRCQCAELLKSSHEFWLASAALLGEAAQLVTFQAVHELRQRTAGAGSPDSLTWCAAARERSPHTHPPPERTAARLL